MREYKCVCHVCGFKFTHKAWFLSSPLSAEIDGELLTVMSCGAHLAHEIREAYLENRQPWRKKDEPHQATD